MMQGDTARRVMRKQLYTMVVNDRKEMEASILCIMSKYLLLLLCSFFPDAAVR